MAEEEKRGRKRAYEDAEQFEQLVDEYFAECEIDKRKPTLSGISLHLGFCDRETFASYADAGDSFARTVKRAKLRIEDNRHQLLVDKTQFTPGIIFDLKNNHDWTDKQEVQHSGTVSIMERISRGRERTTR